MSKYARIIDIEKLLYRKGFCIGKTPDELHEALSELPAIEVRTGEWINYCQDGISHFVGTCSACGRRNDIPPIEAAHYCPSCGAKMKEVYDE